LRDHALAGVFADVLPKCGGRFCGRCRLRRPDSPQVVIAPIALVDLWMMLFDDRQPLDLKVYFNAQLDLVLNGVLAK